MYTNYYTLYTFITGCIQMEPIEIGKFITQPEGFQAFIPNPFPPRDGFEFDEAILKKDDRATLLLGKLDGITTLLPDVDFFLLMYQRKDAASSSQIEGTAATMVGFTRPCSWRNRRKERRETVRTLSDAGRRNLERDPTKRRTSERRICSGRTRPFLNRHFKNSRQ